MLGYKNYENWVREKNFLNPYVCVMVKVQKKSYMKKKKKSYIILCYSCLFINFFLLQILRICIFVVDASHAVSSKETKIWFVMVVT